MARREGRAQIGAQAGGHPQALLNLRTWDKQVGDLPAILAASLSAVFTGDRHALRHLRRRVSTLDQQPENQLAELRRYTAARSWTSSEYVDRGISGAKDRRPALDQLLADARRRRFDALVCWRLDRLGRNLRHLVVLLEELQALGVAFVSLGEGIDATTPAGKLQMHILAAIAEFERARIAERVRAGLVRVRAAGRRLGRPQTAVSLTAVEQTSHLSIRHAAAALGVPRSVMHRARLSRKRLQKSA